MRYLLLLALCLLAFCGSLVSCAAVDATCAANQVNCQTCGQDGFASNDIHGLPRVSRALAPRSADLGDYKWTVCDANGTCGFSVDASDAQSQLIQPLGAAADSPLSYLESLSVYPVFMFSMGLIMLISGFVLCISRYFCCGFLRCFCCCGCGHSYPTWKQGSCSIGFTLQENTIDAADTLEDMEKYAYSRCQVWSSRVFSVLFIGFILSWINVGEFSGNRMVDDAAKAVVRSPDNLVTFLQSTDDPISNFALNLVGGTFIELIADTDNLLYATMNYTIINVELSCVNSTLDDLPAIDYFTVWVNTTEDTVNNVSAILDLVPGELDGLGDSLDGSFDALYADIQTTGADIDAVGPAIDALQPELDNANVVMDDVTAAATGSPKLADDFGALRDDQPTLADVATVRSSLDAVVNTPDSTVKQAADASLQAYADQLSSLPDFSATAVLVSDLNTYIAAAPITVFAELVISLDATRSILEQLNGSSSSLNDSFVALGVEADALNLSNVTDLILQANDTMYSIDFSGLLNEVGKFTALAELLPCLQGINDEFFGINDTLFVIPPEFDQMSSVYASLNASLTPILLLSGEMETQIFQFEEVRSNVSIETMLLDISTMEESLDNTTGNLVESSFIAELAVVEDTLRSISWGIRNDFAVLDLTFQNSLIDASLVAFLNSFETLKQELLVTVAATQADLILYDGGSCSHDGTLFCQVDLDCGGGNTCDLTNENSPRCVNDVSLLCTADTDCVGSRCMVNATRFDGMVDTMQTLFNSTDIPLVNTTVLQMETLTTDAAIDTTTFELELFAAKVAADAVDVTAALVNLNASRASLDIFDVNATMESFTGINDALLSIDLEGLRLSVQGMNASYAELAIAGDNIDDIDEFFAAMEEFHLVQFPDNYYPELQLARLEEVYAESNISNTLMHVMGTLDDMFWWMQESQSFFNVSTNYTQDFQSYVPMIDSLTTDKYSKFGSIHYLTALSYSSCLAGNGTGNCTYFDPEVLAQGRVSTDLQGAAYPDDVQCFTETCMDNTIEFYNTEPINELELDFFVTDYLTLNREQLMAVPYVIPSLIIFLALCGLLPMEKAKYCSSLSLLFIFMLGPFIMIFSGLFFIFPMFVGDVCYGGENVGLQFVQNSDMCLSLNGTGTNTECFLQPIAGYPNVTMTVDVEAIYSALLGTSCGGVYGDPLDAVWDGMEDGVATIPVDFVDQFLALNNPSVANASIQIQPPLASVMREHANSSGIYFSTLISESGDVFSCSNLHSIYAGFKDALCCDVLTAVYWSMGSWCLIAWTLLCCGIPSNLLLRKRNSPTLWGPDFKRAEEAKAAKIPGGGYHEVVHHQDGEFVIHTAEEVELDEFDAI